MQNSHAFEVYGCFVSWLLFLMTMTHERQGRFAPVFLLLRVVQSEKTDQLARN